MVAVKSSWQKEFNQLIEMQKPWVTQIFLPEIANLLKWKITKDISLVNKIVAPSEMTQLFTLVKASSYLIYPRDIRTHFVHI